MKHPSTLRWCLIVSVITPVLLSYEIHAFQHGAEEENTWGVGPPQKSAMDIMLETLCGPSAGPTSDRKTQMLCALYHSRVNAMPSQLERDDDDDEETCQRLPPRTRSFDRHSDSIDLLQLMNHGSEFLDSSWASAKEAMLILGNTGAGKTTITQILVSDLSRIHAVLTQSDRLVIIDDDNRIGAPSTISKTLVPELVPIPNSSMVLYDCPGFDDTRGPEQDIAANFFLNEIVRHVNQVKLLFLVIHSSIRVGNDRLDFDLLADHATRYVKDPQKYKNSMGLVVTKVNSYSGRGKFIKDEVIMREIVEFITTYNHTLHTKLVSEREEDKRQAIMRKVAFVEALLEVDENGTYWKLSFSRDPEKCGPLSQSHAVAMTKQRLKGLYGNLKYTEVTPSDFGYTLKGTTTVQIHKTVMQMNDAIPKSVDVVMSDFLRKLLRKDVRGGGKLSTILQKLSSASAELEGLGNALETYTNRTNDPRYIEEMLSTALKKLGYPIPNNFAEFMERNGRFLEFFDEAVGSPVFRNVGTWIAPVLRVRGVVKMYKDWYGFCSDLEQRVSSYDFQSTFEVPAPSTAGKIDWLAFIRRHNVVRVGDHINSLITQVKDKDLAVLSTIMGHALRQREVACRGNVLTITGNFVRFSELTRLRRACSGNVVEIYACDTLFIDSDLNAVGQELNMVIIAPKWFVVGKRVIDLSGNDGSEIQPPVAPMGRFGDGEHGLPGKPGGPGGYLSGFVSRVYNANQLTITSKGGDGSKGQDGGDGQEGMITRNATTNDATQDWFWTAVVYSRGQVSHVGYQGTGGGDGGNGGPGGLPGYSGSIKINWLSNSWPFGTINVRQGEGNAGQLGRGGQGGAGGRPGNGIKCIKHYVLFWNTKTTCEDTHNYNRASDGTSGISLSTDPNMEQPKRTVKAIDEWQSVLNFRMTFFDNHHDETVQFLSELETSPTVQILYTLEMFGKELLEMNKVTPSEYTDGFRLYSSFIKRLEAYLAKKVVRLMSSSDKQLMSDMLSFAYAKLIAFKQSFPRQGMVVDITPYLTGARAELLQLHDDATIGMSVNRLVTQLETELKRKVDETMALVIRTVIPLLLKAEEDMSEKLDWMEQDIDKHFTKLADNNGNWSSTLSSMKALNTRQVMIGVKLVGEVLARLGSSRLIQGLTFSMNSTVLHGDPEDNGTDVSSRYSMLSADASKLLQLLQNETALALAMISERDVIDGEEEGGNATIALPADAVISLGPGMSHRLYTKFASQNLSILQEFVGESAEFVREVQRRRQEVQALLTPIVQSLMNFFQKLSTTQSNNYDNGAAIPFFSDLYIRDLNVQSRLTAVKKSLQTLVDSIEGGRPYTLLIDRLQDGLTLMAELYHHVELYGDVKRVADYIAFRPPNPVSSSLGQSVSNLKTAMKNQIMEIEYLKAVHAFRQWVFPFAKSQMASVGNATSTSKYVWFSIQANKLKAQMAKFKELTKGGDHFVSADFRDNSSQPFFVWKQSEWEDEIAGLLAGNPVHLKADIRHTSVSEEHRSALRCKLIEINLRMRNPELTSEFQDDLASFGVAMTHSGLSSFVFNGEYFIMKGESKTIQYNFDRDDNGGRRGTNEAYTKSINGDLLLSPFTTWTFRLTTSSSRASFDALRKYAPFVDIELVGTGVYVNGGNSMDLQVGKYYERDDTMSCGACEIEQFYKVGGLQTTMTNITRESEINVPNA